LANEDPDQVRLWMNKVDSTDKLDLDTKWLQRLQNEFDSARVDDQEMCKTLLEIRDEYGYVADPHTAVALAAAKKLGYFGPSTGACLCAVLATASPCKFQESVTEALGEEGWQNYYNSKYFPSHAKLTLNLTEQPVIEYKWTQGADLVAVQTEWELKLRSIIANLSSPMEMIY
jgi:threonine synthase